MRPRALPLAAVIAAFSLGCEPPPSGSDHPSAPAPRASSAPAPVVSSASVSASAPVVTSASAPAPTGSASNSKENVATSGGAPPLTPPPCPPVAPAPEGALAWISGCEIKIAQPVRFDFNKERLRPEALPILDAVAEIILHDASLRVEIRAHLNNRGQSYGRDLSKLRAQSVVRYLVQKKGVDPAQVVAKGYGDNVPVADPKTAEGRTKNLRIEFAIIAPVKPF